MSDAFERANAALKKLEALAMLAAGLNDFWRDLRFTQGNPEPRAIWLARPENAETLKALVARLNQFAREVDDTLEQAAMLQEEAKAKGKRQTTPEGD